MCLLIPYLRNSTGSPANYRRPVAQLAKMTRGRVLLVSYRLAPQNPFPAAIIDVLIAYLSLLYPPLGSFHKALKPSDIVLAGDSAGACLCLAVTQIILSTRRRQATHSPSITFGGRKVDLPLPAGLALLSPFPEQTLALPSWRENGDSDILDSKQSALDPRFPTCKIWPSDPRRGNLYCEVSMLTHPLVSPVLAMYWAEFPPIWIASGSGERLSDATRLLVQNMTGQRASVVWEEYEDMCHIWPIYFPRWKQSHLFWRNCAQACIDMSDQSPNMISGASRIRLESLRKEDLDIKIISRLTNEEALKYMREYQRSAKTFTGRDYKPSL